VKKPVIFAAPIALVLLAVMFFVVMPMLKGKPAAATNEEEDTEAVAKTPAPHVPGLIYPMKERVLNLTPSGGTPHYARIEIAVEFKMPKGAKPAKAGAGHGASTEDVIDPLLEPVVARKAQVDDLLVRIVGAQTLEKLTSAEGKEALKNELLAGVKELVTKPQPVAVYIVKLVVQ
jgi:flagellar basal body-associated protein FliL